MSSELLVKRAKEKNGEAFVQLMEMHMSSMYRVARAYLKNDHDCADAIQETILSCWEKMDSLKKDGYFKTWMIRILINKCKNQLKSCREVYLEDEHPAALLWEQDFSELEWAQVLEAVGATYRDVLILYYAEGYKIPEISQLLEIPEGTVKTRLRRAREKLGQTYYSDRKEGFR